MIPIQEVSNLELAFPAHVRHLMPTMKTIPDEFKNPNRPTKWNRLFRDWFYFGIETWTLTPKPDVDEAKALRHIHAIMSSYEPPHEHKEAAVAFLFSEWFIDVTWKRQDKKL